MEDEIGLMGVIRISEVPNQGTICQLWDTGHVQINMSPFVLLPHGGEFEGKYKEVECLDGLLLITKYDVPFREDLFDG